MCQFSGIIAYAVGVNHAVRAARRTKPTELNMAIRTKHPFKAKFPPTILYLDDIKHISDMMLEWCANNMGDARGRADDPQVGYKVVDRNGTHFCDSIDDLKRIGGAVYELDIGVYGKWSPNLSLWFTPYDTYFNGEEKAERDLYGSLIPIFNNRQRRFWWRSNQLAWGSITTLLLFAAVIIIFRHRIHTDDIKILAKGLFALFGLCAWITLSVGFATWFIRPNYSTIRLRFLSDPVPAAEQWLPARQDLVRDIIKIVVSALIGGFIGWLIGKK
jgi:hypothetical protein